MSIAQSPEIRGVRLGMTTEKLLTAFSDEASQEAIAAAIKDSKNPSNYGFGRVALQPGNTSNPKFANVNYISIEVLDNKVSEFQVGYVGPEWKSVDQFITKLSEAFHLLPAEDWEGPSGPNKALRCNGFAISVYGNPGSPSSSVNVTDVSAPKIVNDRREAAKEQVRQAFKP